MNPNKPIPYKASSSQIAFSCPWYSVRQDHIDLPNGSSATYNVVHIPHEAVFIVPILPSGEILMLHHYRHTVEEWVWEIPAGGSKEGQTILEAARMELAEEVGGTAEEFVYLGEFYTAVGFCDELCHVFLAKNVQIGETAREPLEFMEVVKVQPEQAFEMARNGQMKDGLSALAMLRVENYFRQQQGGA
ncbi:MAG: NUDIX hydrolase [Chloroflexota bacterium]